MDYYIKVKSTTNNDTLLMETMTAVIEKHRAAVLGDNGATSHAWMPKADWDVPIQTFLVLWCFTFVLVRSVPKGKGPTSLSLSLSFSLAALTFLIAYLVSLNNWWSLLVASTVAFSLFSGVNQGPHSRTLERDGNNVPQQTHGN
jgi:VIT1/CCC1 family predicted Fe2+/Mn2+ transporter